MYQIIAESQGQSHNRPILTWARTLVDSNRIDFEMPIIETILPEHTEGYFTPHILDLKSETCHEISVEGDVLSLLNEEGYYESGGLSHDPDSSGMYNIRWFDTSSLKIPWGISIENEIITCDGKSIGLFGTVDLRITQVNPYVENFDPSVNPIRVKDMQSWLLPIISSILGKILKNYPCADIMTSQKKNIEQEVLTSMKEIFSHHGISAEYFIILGIKRADSQPYLNTEGKEKAQKLLDEFELELREFIQVTLKKRYGTHWWFRGVPDSIQQAANYQLQKLNVEEPNVHYEIFHLLTLYQYNSIILDAQNWEKIYADLFPNKETAKFLLNKIRIIRNKMAHLHERDEDIIKCAVYIEDIRKYF